MHARTYRRAFALLLPALGMLAAATVIAPPAQAAPVCSMTYAADGWPGTAGRPAGFMGSFTLTNNATTKTKGWRVEVHFQAGVDVTQNWNSEIVLDAEPVYVFGNVSWNGGISPGGSVEFGVIATKTADTISNTPRSYVCAPLF